MIIKLKKRYLLAAIILIAFLIGISVAVTLFHYTTTISITGVQQLTQGANSLSWTVYQNEVGTEYVPQGAVDEAYSPTNSSTYAFSVTTDSHENCSVEINLQTAVSTDFSSFEITVLSWTGSAWTSAQLYTTATGSTPLTYIDGTMPSTAGYIQQTISTTTSYLVEINYAYTPPTSGSYMVDLQFTPMPYPGT